MKGDFTRDTFDPTRHYQQVLQQQGRVQLDADWNEQAAISAYRAEAGMSDTVGHCGGAADEAAFAILTTSSLLASLEGAPTTPIRQFALSKGRYYVDGLLCEVETPVLYSWQPDLKSNARLAPGSYLVYLDVWLRHITVHERDDLRESALAGPDTTTRVKTVWQVRTAPLDSAPGSDPCTQSAAQFTQRQRPSLPCLAARTRTPNSESDPCKLPSTAGYRGLENQLYRVEIHRSGGMNVATYKASRDNGSVATRILGSQLLAVTGGQVNILTVSSTGPDSHLGFQKEDLVEIIHDSQELENQPGTLARIADIDDALGTITLKRFETESMPIPIVPSDNPRLRRWDFIGTVPATTGNPADGSGFVELEAGVLIGFKLPTGSEFRTGDYWQIPARTASPDAESGKIQWPRTNTDADFQPPRGIQHHYCRLGVITVDPEGAGAPGIVHRQSDCRCLWPALTSVPRLFYVSGDGQEVMPDLTTPAGIWYKLPRPLVVGVANAHCLRRPHSVRFERLSPSTGTVVAAGINPGATAVASVDLPLNPEGLAQCDFHLDNSQPTQQVRAQLLDADNLPVSLPIVFNANLSIASQVAYLPNSACVGLPDQKTVQDAITRLARLPSLTKLSGDGQDGLPGTVLPLPVRVAVFSACGPVPNGLLVSFDAGKGAGAVGRTRADAADPNASEIVSIETQGGVAQCFWRLGSTPNVQELAVTIPAASDGVPIPEPRRVAFTANLQNQSVDPTIRVTGIYLNSAPAYPLPIDSPVSVSELELGIHVALDANPVSVYPNPRPLCSFEVEVPLSAEQGSGATGYFPVVLASQVRLQANEVACTPTPEAVAWIQPQLQNDSQKADFLARFTLRGNYIWAQDPIRYLDAETFGLRPETNAFDLDLSGDRRRGGNLETWYWLVSDPILRILPGWNLIAYHLIRGNNRLSELFADIQVPEGSQVFVWRNGQFAISTLEFGAWSADLLLRPGDGAYFLNPSPRTLVVRMVGALTTILPENVPPGLHILSSPSPVRAAFDNVVGRQPLDGETVYRLIDGRGGLPNPDSSGGFQLHTFSFGEWQPAAPRLRVGESAWFRLNQSGIRDRINPILFNTPSPLNLDQPGPLRTPILRAPAPPSSSSDPGPTPSQDPKSTPETSGAPSPAPTKRSSPRKAKAARPAAPETHPKPGDTS